MFVGFVGQALQPERANLTIFIPDEFSIANKHTTAPQQKAKHILQ